MKIDLIDEVAKPLNEFISKETEMLIFPEHGLPMKIDTKHFRELGMFADEKPLIAEDGG